MKRRRLLVLLLAAGGVAAALRRLASGRRGARVDLYFEDGSLATLDEGAAEGAELLALAADVRRAAA